MLETWQIITKEIPSRPCAMHTDNQQCGIDTTNYNFPRKFIRQRKEIKKKRKEERERERKTHVYERGICNEKEIVAQNCDRSISFEGKFEFKFKCEQERSKFIKKTKTNLCRLVIFSTLVLLKGK